MALIRQPVIENGRTWWKPVGNAAIGKCTHCCRAYAWKPGRGRTLSETYCPRCLGMLEQTSLALFRKTRWFSLDAHGEKLTGHPLAPEVKSGEINPWAPEETQLLKARIKNLKRNQGVWSDRFTAQRIAEMEAQLAELEAR